MWWASNHAEHHRHCEDTLRDPHTPTARPGPLGRLRGFAHAHVLWMTRREHFLVSLENVAAFRPYPELWLCDVFSPYIFIASVVTLHHALEKWAQLLPTAHDAPSRKSRILEEEVPLDG